MQRYKSLIVLIVLLLTPYFSSAQRAASSGEFQLGMRSTTSLFGNNGHPGYGIGGQWRLRLGDRLNTEWFADYITTNLGGFGHRADAHIGWSVMFYPFQTTHGKFIDPFFLAGHCFDYTKITLNNHHGSDSRNRLSSATQAGLGTNFNLSDNFDLTLSTQYMMHLGDDLHTVMEDHHGETELHFVDDRSSLEEHGHGHALGLEGHVLVTLSLNVKLIDLWK